MSSYDMTQFRKDLLEFVKGIADKYEQILHDTASVVKAKKKAEGNVKKYNPSHFALHTKDYRLVDAILSSNKFDGKAKVVRKSDKLCKRYDFYCIKKIARIFYTAFSLNSDTAKELLEVPDVHFIVTTIKKDLFGDLKRFMSFSPKASIDMEEEAISA